MVEQFFEHRLGAAQKVRRHFIIDRNVDEGVLDVSDVQRPLYFGAPQVVGEAAVVQLVLQEVVGLLLMRQEQENGD